MYRCLLACLAIVSASFVRADNWPQWRGPANDGISKEKGLPHEWSATKNIAWKLKMPGMGSSTPCIWDKHIFLTCEEGTGEDKYIVLLSVSTDGKEQWKHKIATKSKWFRGEGNHASASPSTDGKHVWAFAGSGELVCCDFAGNEVWKADLQERYGKFSIMHGFHSTPLLHGGRLYVQLIHSGGAYVLALDKASGKEVWKVKRESDGRGENEHSYASPCVWTNGKDAYLITHGNDYAIAHQLEDGKEIWRVGGLNPKGKQYRGDLRFVASPVATAELIVVPSAKDHGVVGVKPDATGLVMPGSKGEQWRMTRNTPDVPCPLVHDGLVYLCRENGTVICLDAKTGQEHYSQRIHSARYRASPLYADGKIYLTSQDGYVTVIKAGAKFEKLAENKLPDQLNASPAVANGRIYLRGWETLYAIEASK